MLTLYAATIPSYLQILSSIGGLIDKAEDFCRDKGLAPDELIEARLTDDMNSFAYQVKSTAIHSIGAIEGVRAGAFSPDTATPPASFDEMRTRMEETRSALQLITVEDMESFIGRDMRFEVGERRVEFRAEDFLLSFSQPNFYFHAATAYDILRMKGVPLGKRDFLGPLRLKSA